MESRPSIEIHLLGPIRLTIDGQDVQLGGPRQQALLALLALRPGRPWTPDELIEELWTGEPTSGAETTLRSYVSRLRRALGEAASIERGNGGYILHVTPAAVDAIAFEAAVRSAGEAMARGATRIARQQLGAALATWQGTPFGDLAGDGTLQAAATRLEERRLLALERRIEADLELGRAAEVVDELEGLVHDHPFREALWRHLMLALYRQGRQADALAAYHRARAQLDEHLGIEPGPELRELEAAILRQDVPEVARSAAQWNLPVALTSFIGRAVELEEVGRLIDSNRLVTLTGVGGVGKTRLAIEAARAAAGTFDDGIWFVDQAPLADPELVAATVANVLGIAHPASSPPIASIANQLGDRRILLILDNCEHLRDACAELAAGLLAGAAGVHILATSRVTLGISGEVDYAVPPLALPAPGDEADATNSDAVDLFVDRARAARSGVAPDASSLATVARIVRDLDGLPLAIELAAARAKALTLADIAARLDDRFRFLVSWRRLSAARHRTLAEAMAWSFDLLDEESQALLASLSVFAGSFDLDAVAAVCLDGDRTRALDLVQRLVDASLVILVAAPEEGSRYRVLETVRQYGADRLVAMGRSDALRRAHAVYFAVFAEALPITGSEQARALARLDVERDNLRAAIDSAILLGDPVLERRITGDLWRYWQVRGFLAEGAARLEATVGQGPNVAPEFYAQAVVGAGNLAWAMGRYEDGKRHGHELLRLAEASGALRTAYVGNRLLAAIALRERDFETSERYSTRAVELIREVGAPMEIAMAEMNYAVLLMDWGQIDTSIELYRGVLGRFEALGSREGVGLTRLNLGEAAFLQGRDGDARAQFEAAREAFTSIGFRAHVGHATQGLAAVEARSGDAGVAANFLGRADAILTEVGASADDFNPRMVADAAAAARTVLGDEAYAAAFDAGWRAERSHSPG